MTSFTHPLVAFSEPARAGASWARTLVGLLLCGLFIFGFVQFARVGMAYTLFGQEGAIALRDQAAAAAEFSSPATPLGVMLILGAFMAVWPALWLVLPVVHRRPAKTLFGPSGEVNWRHFRIGLGAALILGAGAWAPLLIVYAPELDRFGPLRSWAVVALFALPFVFVQCAAEELLFRGYLLQQFAARSMSVLGWSVLPSLLFAMAHPTGESAIGISWFHFIFGLVMAAVTSRTANIGAAFGLHFGNNIINILIVAPADMISGLALFAVPAEIDTTLPRVIYVAIMFIGAAIFMALMDVRFVKQWRAARRAEGKDVDGLRPWMPGRRRRRVAAE